MSLEMLKDADDQLISNLSYKNPSTASYILERNSSSFQAVGSNVYKPSAGVKIIRFQINSEDFLDPNSLRVQFDIKNNDGTKVLYPINAAHGFFSRGRLLSRGVVVEDISQFNRVSEMLSFLKSSGTNNDDMSESFLNDYSKSNTGLSQELIGIPVGARQTVLFKPCFGLLNQPKYISLKYSPLSIELELDSDILANIIKPDSGANYNSVYASTAVSTDWEIQNCVIRCDTIKIDSELQNKYDDYLMKEDGGINLTYTTYHSQILKTLAPNMSVNLSRSLTYLTRVYASFIKDTTVTGGATANPLDFWMKQHNTFYHTLRKYNRLIEKNINVPNYKQNEDLVQSCQIQIGNKLIPDYPLTSSTEAYYFLKKAYNLNSIFNSHVHSFNIKAKDYLDNKFIMVFDCEKINGHVAAFTGKNVKNGEQITLKLKMQEADTSLNPEDCHVILEAQQVLEIKSTYTRVAD